MAAFAALISDRLAYPLCLNDNYVYIDLNLIATSERQSQVHKGKYTSSIHKACHP